MNRVLRDCTGSSILEFTLVFPVLILVALGTIDFTYMLYEWTLANKAVYVGARIAIVSNPVASGITSLSYDASLIGSSCFDAATGTTNGNCPSVSTVCTPASGTAGSCSDGSTFDNSAFCRIFTGDATCPAIPVSPSMKSVFPRLQRENVQISYTTNGLGFVGRPDGLPMDVTVSITCMTHDFYFIGGLMAFFAGSAWTYTVPDGCPAAPAGPQIPAFATTLTSEDMTTN